jgi:hypothetical protein
MSTQKMMNPVWIVLVGVIIILFLSACDETPADKNAIKSEDIVVSNEMKTSNDWTRFFIDLYEPMMVCARNHTSQPAVILDATPMNKGRALITVRGSDQVSFECMVEFGNDKIEKWTAINTQNNFSGAVFRPEGAGLPLPDSCLNNVEIKTKENQSVGWLSYRRADCR